MQWKTVTTCIDLETGEILISTTDYEEVKHLKEVKTKIKDYNNAERQITKLYRRATTRQGKLW